MKENSRPEAELALSCERLSRRESYGLRFTENPVEDGVDYETSYSGN